MKPAEMNRDGSQAFTRIKIRLEQDSTLKPLAVADEELRGIVIHARQAVLEHLGIWIKERNKKNNKVRHRADGLLEKVRSEPLAKIRDFMKS